MENFPDITKELTSINEKLEICAKQIVFINGKTFKLEKYKIDLLEIPKDVMGIYFFEIKKNEKSQNFNDWMNNFREKWTIFNVKNRPIIRKKSVDNLSKHNDEWIPFYIGKSKNIQYRVNQHISAGVTTTSALKLITMGNLTNETFRLSYIEINIGDKFYDLVMPKIEKVLRDELNPIIGKQ